MLATHFKKVKIRFSSVSNNTLFKCLGIEETSCCSFVNQMLLAASCCLFFLPINPMFSIGDRSELQTGQFFTLTLLQQSRAVYSAQNGLWHCLTQINKAFPDSKTTSRTVPLLFSLVRAARVNSSMNLKFDT